MSPTSGRSYGYCTLNNFLKIGFLLLCTVDAALSTNIYDLKVVQSFYIESLYICNF